ncbi:hypothetical protein AX774_g4363 [Zancudomyces culisetae]|uniref:Uncharacterized protein n=1 Tax=Zancudomyces culisetae TaxID=1213189 RepID=A0A1R1PMJ0_ZANCU|nr:hypothetical protein AX774_g4443 [Zancudomyces culisetae]OMH82166.1 hypothetical protein AX774_g4363 [Zancudomyces culisetae]|eukprot:OMH82084.1 hypothetical protein AX774_g4443 [Zancudomyces culisetae]
MQQRRQRGYEKPKNTEEQTGTFLYRSDNLEFSYLDPRPLFIIDLPIDNIMVAIFIAVATYLRISETIKSIPITTSVLDIMEKLDTQFKIIINGVSKDFDLLFNLEVAENFRLLDTTKSRMLEAFVSKSE